MWCKYGQLWIFEAKKEIAWKSKEWLVVSWGQKSWLSVELELSHCWQGHFLCLYSVLQALFEAGLLCATPCEATAITGLLPHSRNDADTSGAGTELMQTEVSHPSVAQRGRCNWRRWADSAPNISPAPPALLFQLLHWACPWGWGGVEEAALLVNGSRQCRGRSTQQSPPRAGEHCRLQW